VYGPSQRAGAYRGPYRGPIMDWEGSAWRPGPPTGSRAAGLPGCGTEGYWRAEAGCSAAGVWLEATSGVPVTWKRPRIIGLWPGYEQKNV